MRREPKSTLTRDVRVIFGNFLTNSNLDLGTSELKIGTPVILVLGNVRIKLLFLSVFFCFE